MAPGPLQQLAPTSDAPHAALDALDAFIGARLYAAGVWESPRTSDGIRTYRLLERNEMRVRACGEIWSIEQTLHTFWLDFEREAGTERWRWTLYFDVDRALSERRRRDAIDLLEAPGSFAWEVTLTGDDLLG